MNALKIFEHERFGEIRVVERDGEPWFIAKNVCDALGLDNSRQAVARLDDDERDTVILNDGTPGNPDRIVISESGLYSLVIRSDKPEAKEFRRWVTHEVLPSIRKHGAYMTDSLVDKVMQDPAIIYAMAETILTERSRREVAEEKLRYLRPDVPFGTISETTGRPRNHLVKPHYRSVRITITAEPVIEWQRSLFENVY